MSSSHQLYQCIETKLQSLLPNIHQKRFVVLIWIVVGLIQGKSVHLSQIANAIPGETGAAGRIMRVRRWLASKWIDSQTLYTPLIQEVLEAWSGCNATIIIDGCFIRHKKLQILRVSLAHCFRALPLAWQVSTNKGLVTFEMCEDLLDHVAKLLRKTKRVTLLADRGFRDRDWARKCQQNNWDYIIRIPNNTIITFADGRQFAISELTVPKGQKRYFPNVRLTMEGDWLCNLAVTWTEATKNNPSELCALITNRHASAWVLKYYLRRMQIEQSFRDEKSGAFDLHASHLNEPKRLDNLLLAIAIAVLWIYELGQQILIQGKRSLIDPGNKRQLSIFQLGWRYLRRLVYCQEPPLFNLQLRPCQLRPIRSSKC